MLTRKTQYAWMSLGGLICLFGVVLACKLRDGNRAAAQLDLSPPPAIAEMSKPQAPPNKVEEKSPPALPPFLRSKAPKEVLPPPNSEKPKENVTKHWEPKATLEMPTPSNPPPPTPSSTILPASFGLNEPSPPLPPPSKKSLNQAASPKVAKETPSKVSISKVAPPSPPPLTPPSTPTNSTAAAGKLTTQDKKSDTHLPARWEAPLSVPPPTPVSANDPLVRTQAGEPPLAPAPGPVQIYHVHGAETLHEIARRTLGSGERWSDLHKLNPSLNPNEPLHSGTTVRLPSDACVQAEDAEPVKPLPALHPKPPAPKAKVLPLTGTYQCSLDEKGQLTLPRALRDQLAGGDTVLLSPGPDKCLWLTNPAHLERLGERLDQSQANEADVRVFKRLYFAQTEKMSINADGRVTIPERLGQFAGLHQEVVLVGIDDHFEVWDAARWRAYTQQKSTGHYGTAAE